MTVSKPALLIIEISKVEKKLQSRIEALKMHIIVKNDSRFICLLVYE